MQILHFQTPRKAPLVPVNALDHLSDKVQLSDRSPAQPIVVLPHPGALRAQIARAAEQAEKFIANARARNTLRAYRSDWQDFVSWCQAYSLQALPALPETVALYLTELADDHKVSTIQRRLTAIGVAHAHAQLDSPSQHTTVRSLMAGIRRTLGVAQEGKAPALTEDVKAMVAGLGQTRHALQERALLLLGFAGAFRRSELVGLNVEELKFGRQGLAVTLRRSKTDQEGQGRLVGIMHGSEAATCPVRSLRAWLKAAGIESGAVFRSIDRAGRMGDRLSDKAVARAVKRGAVRAGLDPALYAGHSLRAGLVTSAAAAGVEERIIMRQTGHTSQRMVRKYMRDAEIFRDNASGQVGL